MRTLCSAPQKPYLDSSLHLRLDEEYPTPRRWLRFRRRQLQLRWQVDRGPRDRSRPNFPRSQHVNDRGPVLHVMLDDVPADEISQKPKWTLWNFGLAFNGSRWMAELRKACRVSFLTGLRVEALGWTVGKAGMTPTEPKRPCRYIACTL